MDGDIIFHRSIETSPPYYRFSFSSGDEMGSEMEYLLIPLTFII